VSLLFRCDAHLSNLALGSSGKAQVQLEATRFKLRRVSKSFEPFTLDQTRSLSRPDASGQY
jgi:hypothetical protein